MPDESPIASQRPDPATVVSRHGARIQVIGDLRTPNDREYLRVLAKQAIEEAGAKKPELVVDISRARYLDVGALTSLTMIARECQRRGMRLTIAGASDEFIDLIGQTKLNVLLAVCDARLT